MMDAFGTRSSTSSVNRERGRQGKFSMQVGFVEGRGSVDSSHSHHSPIATSPKIGQKSLDVQLSQVVEVVQSLLQMHELRLAMGLLEHLGGSSLGKAMLPFGQEQLHLSISTFFAQAQNQPFSEEANRLLAPSKTNNRRYSDKPIDADVNVQKSDNRQMYPNGGTHAAKSHPRNDSMMSINSTKPSAISASSSSTQPPEPPMTSEALQDLYPRSDLSICAIEENRPSKGNRPGTAEDVNFFDERFAHKSSVSSQGRFHRDRMSASSISGSAKAPGASSSVSESDVRKQSEGRRVTWSAQDSDVRHRISEISDDLDDVVELPDNKTDTRSVSISENKTDNRASQFSQAKQNRQTLQSQFSQASKTRSKNTTTSFLDDDSDSDDEQLEGFNFAETMSDKKSTRNSSWFEIKEKYVIAEENAHRLAKPSHSFIIHPNHTARTIWDFVSFILIVLESVTIPLSISFDADMPDVWYLFSTVFFSIDIVLASFTGFFVEGLLVMKQSLILKRYFKGFFIVDFFSAFPWEMVFNARGDENKGSGAVRMFKLLRLSRLLRLMKLRDLLLRLEELLPHTSTAFSFLNTLGFLLLLCHWSACSWGFLGNPVKLRNKHMDSQPHDLSECEPGGPCEPGIFGSPWMHRYGMQHISVEDKYLASLYFATGVMTGNDVGMDASHWPERIFVIVMMIISFLVCSTVLSEIVVMIQKMKADSAEFNERLRQMKEFMVKKKVPLTVQTKIQRYLEFQHKSQRSGMGDQQILFAQLSPWLRFELTEHLNGEIIRRHPFFQELPRKVFKHVCSVCNTVLYAPGDVIMQRGHRAACMCFIVHGKLHVQQASSRKSEFGAAEKPIIMSPPTFLGDACLFKESIRGNSVVALTHAELLLVHTDDLKPILLEFPKVKVMYESWVKIYENEAKAGLRCAHCGQMGHSSENCTLMTDHLRVLGNASNTNLQSRKTRVDVRKSAWKTNSGRFTNMLKRATQLPSTIFNRGPTERVVS